MWYSFSPDIQVAGLDLNDHKDLESLCSSNANGQARYIPPHLRSGNNNSADSDEQHGEDRNPRENHREQNYRNDRNDRDYRNDNRWVNWLISLYTLTNWSNLNENKYLFNRNNRRYGGRNSDRQERGDYNNYSRNNRREDSYQNGGKWFHFGTYSSDMVIETFKII